MAHNYRCRRCGCTLDPAEMPICEECQEEMKQEEEQRRFYRMTREDQKAVKRVLRGA